MADGTVGYLQLNNMEPRDSEEFFGQMDSLFSQTFDGVSTVIVDIRANGGGDDRTALRMASYFVSEPNMAFVKRAKDRDDFTEPVEIFIEPHDPAYRHDGKVIVIMSESSASAAEIFALAMAQLPQTITMGRNTQGALSYILSRRLPNGWYVGLSNEEYRSPSGDLYEATGVPPAALAEAEMLPLSERQAGVDSWLDSALSLACNPDATLPPSSDQTDAPTEEPSSAAISSPIFWFGALLVVVPLSFVVGI
jgi:C-terminal processing protease CtpA/Prc